MWVARRFLSSIINRGGQSAGQVGLFQSPPRCFAELRYLQCTCCWRSRIPIAGFETLNPIISSSGDGKDDQRSLDSFYTSDQRSVILNLLNNATVSELTTVKLLRGRKSVNIVDHRTKNGPFKTLESVTSVPLLKHKSAVVVFNSILNPPQKKEKKVKINLAKFIRPEVDRSWLEEASSIVSLICGTNSVAWAHVDRGMTVLDWQQWDCPNFLKKTYEASSYLNDISHVVSLLPSADFYIVEKNVMSTQNAALFPVTAHMRTVEAMLFALLERPHSEIDANTPPRVLNMKRGIVGRHFGLMIGESRTSGAEMVRQMMTESVTQKLPRLNFPHDLLIKYRDAFQMGRGRGDELSDALLQGVAFYELLSESSD